MVSQLGFLILDSPDEQGTEPVKQTSAQNPRNVLRTDVGDLANDFHAAMEAMNQVSEDIHVGKLLKACDRLAATMRKIGFTQGARDISGNIAKIRNLYDTAPSSHRDSMPALLQYEMELGVHGHGEVKRIKDPSAAMGFLWLGRTLNYQHDMFKYMLDEKEEPYNAAKHAYEQDLKHHHSWALQKVCQAAMVSLKSMKRSTVMSTLGGFHEGSFGDREDEATNRDLHHMMSFWRPMLSRWRQVFPTCSLRISNEQTETLNKASLQGTKNI